MSPDPEAVMAQAMCGRERPCAYHRKNAAIALAALTREGWVVSRETVGTPLWKLFGFKANPDGYFDVIVTTFDV